MSRQRPVLRRAIRLARRHKFIFGIMVILGAAGGGAYAQLHPPLSTATALVLLPQSGQTAQNGASAANADAANPYISTQELVPK